MTRLPERSAPESLGFTRAGLERLTSALSEQIERKRLPGVVAMIVRRGKLAYLEALGQRDPASADAMRPDSIFRIYSMTKPVVSVAAMMLFEEGKLSLSDPVAKYLPEFKDTPVGVVRADGQIEHVPASHAMTVQDLLRHTSGLTYEILAEAPIRRLYARAKIYRRDWTNEAFSKALAALPLMYQPGTVWDYSRATDVLGRVVEVVSGQALRDFFRARIFEPLGMVDTGFHVPESQHHRLAEPFALDPDSGAEVKVLDVREPVAMDMGGGGLVSTAADYARFCQMLINGGVLDGHRLLSRKTVELMTSDHLGGAAQRERSASARARFWPGVCCATAHRHGAGGRVGRALLLGRHGGHHLFHRPRGRALRRDDGAGPRAEQRGACAVSQPGLCRLRRLTLIDD